MRFKIYLLALIMATGATYAQNKFRVVVKDKTTKETLPGTRVMLKGSEKGAAANADGIAEIQGITDGKHTFIFSMVGYETEAETYNFPLKQDSLQVMYLDADQEELGEVQVSATRSSRTISDIPTRIETIASGELAEKAGMQSANIKMIMTESTGIQTQQTSAVSGNTSIRIQGLDGKYTQLLKDGLPLYSGFAGGLSIMQIPPLDLKRVEVIKGSASTLYGGGAIAGLINLVSKEPTDKNEFSLMANTTSIGGLELNTFYSHKFDKIGVTVFGSRNSQTAYDPNKDNFSDVPQNVLYSFNPKVFYYIDPTSTISLGLNTNFENRIGGDMSVIENKADNVHTFYERDKSERYSTQLKYEKTFENKHVLTAKNSISWFSRAIEMPSYLFDGHQTSSFSEVSYLIPGEKSEWIAGLNEWTDRFAETQPSFYLKRDYSQFTAGAFVQNNLKATDKLIIESGLRVDYLNMQSPYSGTKNYAFILPRLSLLYKFSSGLTTRLGGGLGYKAPGIFAEEAETQGFRNVMPINLNNTKPEQSVGINWDVNYKVVFDELSVNINQMFFFTLLNNPVIPNAAQMLRDTLNFENANGHISSKGCETNIKLRHDDFSVYLGYTFIDAQRNINGVITENPLTAQHRLYITPTYEVENKIRIGYEVFYVSPQTLYTGEKVRDYWLMGISAEKFFKHFSLFANFENMLDSRQSRWQPMYTGAIQNPHFAEIWAPADGFVCNAGFRIML